jgi:hypothetical protein
MCYARSVLKVRALLIPLATLALAAPPARAISLVFDYTYDSGGFFTSNPTAVTALDSVAQFFSTNLIDSLSAVTTNGFNTWSVDFFNPATGSGTVSHSDLSLAAGEVRIFVGGADLGSGTLGLGGPGGYHGLFGTPSFVNAASTRGQAGVSTNTDFGPWGGSISFNSTASWYFDSDPSTSESFSSSASDFYSVALHEVGHVLGIGTADSWDTLVSSGSFLGAASGSAFGGPVPLNPTSSHWASDTMSTIYGTGTSQEAAMDPELTTGTRKLFTTLDMAALDDIGWTLAAVPEPAATRLMLAALVVLLVASRRRARVRAAWVAFSARKRDPLPALAAHRTPPGVAAGSSPAP